MKGWPSPPCPGITFRSTFLAIQLLSQLRGTSEIQPSLPKGNSTIGAQRPTACLSKARGFITKQSQNRASPGFLRVQYPSSTQAGTRGGQGNASPTRTNEE